MNKSNDSIVPSFVELLVLYYRAECSNICEHSGDISGDILRLYRKCGAWCAWSQEFRNGLTEYEREAVRIYEEEEKEWEKGE